MTSSRYSQEIAKRGVYLVAEAGSNHNGSLREAKRLITLAAQYGADAIKFQLFAVETLLQPDVLGGMLGLEKGWAREVKKLEFKLSWLPVLKRLADRAQIDFLCTPFDELRLAALLELAPPALKIASGDITHYSLLKKAAQSELPIILSTGASNEEEIKKAVAITGYEKTSLLQCVMRYPAHGSSYHPDRLKMLAEHAPVVGISDHSEGYLVAARAVEAGALIVERHFTRKRSQKGADHAMSIEPAGLLQLKGILLESLRLRMEGPTPEGDDRERVYARRGLYCRNGIQAGEKFSEANCIALRPAGEDCLPASEYECLWGRIAKRSYAAGEPISSGELA